MTVYVNNRRESLEGLCQTTGRSPIIMADKGSVSSSCPELITGSNSTSNKYRLLVGRHFGMVSRAFPLTCEHFDDYTGAMCLLTNAHVYCQKLREKMQNTAELWSLCGGRERHRVSVKNSRSKQASSQVDVESRISKEDAQDYPWLPSFTSRHSSGDQT